MSGERAGHMLRTTAILNETYLRLVDNTKPVWQGSTQFIAAGEREWTAAKAWLYRELSEEQT
jgi:hypothetical protein